MYISCEKRGHVYVGSCVVPWEGWVVCGGWEVRGAVGLCKVIYL